MTSLRLWLQLWALTLGTSTCHGAQRCQEQSSNETLTRAWRHLMSDYRRMALPMRFHGPRSQFTVGWYPFSGLYKKRCYLPLSACFWLANNWLANEHWSRWRSLVHFPPNAVFFPVTLNWQAQMPTDRLCDLFWLLFSAHASTVPKVRWLLMTNTSGHYSAKQLTRFTDKLDLFIFLWTILLNQLQII